MQRPNLRAHDSEWLQWANEHYPFEGYRPFREGFDILRGIEDPQLRIDAAQALARSLPPDVSPRAGFRRTQVAPEPDSRLPPERDFDSDLDPANF